MRIEELDNRNALEPGQLLVVLKCWRFCGNTDFFHLQQSVKMRASEILSTSSGAGSVDFPTEELQTVPASENNE